MAGQLTLSNISAQFIKDKELIGKQDPYLIFDCGGQQTTTGAIKSGGTDCVWTESYHVPKAGNVLKVTAYNKNTLRPDGLLGVGELQLTKCTTGSTTRIPLMDKTGKDVGEVSVNVSGAGIGSSGTTSGVNTSQATTGTGVHQGVGGVAAGSGATQTRHTEQHTGLTGAGVGTGVHGTHGTAGTHTTGVTGTHTTGVTGTHTTGVTGTHTTGETGTGVHGTHGTEGVHSGVTTGTTTNRDAKDALCGREFFTKVEDRTVDKEEVIRIREHHPVEKQFVVETRPTGEEREQTGAQKMETLDRTTRVVGAHKGDPCSGVPTGGVHREV